MICRGLVLIVVAASAWQTPVRDTPAKPRIGTGTVAGTVVAGIGAESQPARRARVVLQDVEDFREGRTATTDDEGRFEFRDLPAGRFTVEVHKPGYLTARYGAARPERAGTPITVTAGGNASGLAVRLTRGAAISGTVRDSRGRPIPRVTISPLRYGYSSFGERRLLAPRGTATTDDRGTYRAWGLPEGEYVVMAVPSAPGTPANSAAFQLLSPELVDRTLVSSGEVALELRGTYAPIYFPSSVDPARAVTLSLAAGEEREGVDFAATLVQTFDVRSTVRLQDGSAPPATTVTLTRSGEMDLMLAGSVRPASMSTDAEGRVVFRDVAPGTYTILAKTRATAGGLRGGAVSAQPASVVMWAMSPVVMSGAHVDLPLQLAPAMTVAGRLIFDGASPAPADVTALQIYLVPPGPGPINAGPEGGRLNADATFSFVGVTPGGYRIVYANTSRLMGHGWLRSATANGRDVLDAPLTVAPGENVDLAITFSDRTTELAGTFQDATGRPAPDYFIVVFSADQTYWTPGSRRVRSARPANDGAFSVQGLPAGEYLVAALTDLEPNDLHARSFLEQLATAAARVTLVDGKVTRQDLRVGK